MDDRVIPTLDSERLRLRPFRASDFEDYAAMCGDPEVGRHLMGGVLGREVAWRHMAFLVGHWHLRGCGMWAVEEKGSGAFVGRIGFADPDGWPGFELGWTLVRSRWGRGYATEGARAALAWAFDVLGEDRIISLIQPGNDASIRVAERLGESLQGQIEFLGKTFLVYGIDHSVAATSSTGSRYSSTASRTLAMASSAVSPSLMQPGRVGT